MQTYKSTWKYPINYVFLFFRSVVCADHSFPIFLLKCFMCQFYLFFFLALKIFLPIKRSITKRKPSILRNRDGQFPAFLDYINNRNLFFSLPVVSDDWFPTPAPSVLNWKSCDPQSFTQILLDSPSSENKFLNFTHLESERHLFLQSIKDLQWHN